MKNTPKRMLASNDLDTLPGDRMRWDEWYKAWVRDVESDQAPDAVQIVPGENEEGSTETLIPDLIDEWVDDVNGSHV